MPNRVIRDGFVCSERIHSLNYEEECFYHRLLLRCDDAGRHDGRIAILRSSLFPLGIRPQTAPVHNGIDACKREKLILHYDVKGKPYIQVTHWKRASNAKLSKFPGPDGTFDIRFVKVDTPQGEKEFVDTSLLTLPDTPPNTYEDEDGDGDGETGSHTDPIPTPSKQFLSSHPEFQELMEYKVPQEWYIRLCQSYPKAHPKTCVARAIVSFEGDVNQKYPLQRHLEFKFKDDDRDASRPGATGDQVDEKEAKEYARIFGRQTPPGELHRDKRQRMKRFVGQLQKKGVSWKVIAKVKEMVS